MFFAHIEANLGDFSKHFVQKCKAFGSASDIYKCMYCKHIYFTWITQLRGSPIQKYNRQSQCIQDTQYKYFRITLMSGNN